MIALDVIRLTDPVEVSAERIDRSCRDVGFFLIDDAAVPRVILDEAWDAAVRFFAAPEEQKMTVAFEEAGEPYGYAPFRYEALARSEGADGGSATAGDWKETFSVGPDCLGDDGGPVVDPAEAWLRTPSRWPAFDPELRPSWEAYFRALSAVSADLLSIMAVALDLAPDHFEPLIDRHTGAMRALHYPPLRPADRAAGVIRAGAHSDYGTLTILRTDGVPGLQVEIDGAWHDVAHQPGTLVVNLGDSIAQWTNDRWRSTRHRVVADDPRRRHSIAFFHMANWDAVIECLPTCRPATGAPRHPPVQAGPWLMRKFQATVT